MGIITGEGEKNPLKTKIEGILQTSDYNASEIYEQRLRDACNEEKAERVRNTREKFRADVVNGILIIDREQQTNNAQD